jgi:hypothetical protein
MRTVVVRIVLPPTLPEEAVGSVIHDVHTAIETQLIRSLAPRCRPVPDSRWSVTVEAKEEE